MSEDLHWLIGLDIYSGQVVVNITLDFEARTIDIDTITGYKYLRNMLTLKHSEISLLLDKETALFTLAQLWLLLIL